MAYNGPTGLFINNEFVDAVDGRTFETINPVTEKVLANVARADKADVDKAVAAARKAFESYSVSTGDQRRDWLYKLALLMEEKENRKRLAEVECMDNGKPVRACHDVDLHLAIQCFKYYAGWADKKEGKVLHPAGGQFVYTRHEPVGACGAIIPWNFPLLMAAWKLGPLLAAGCTCVMKTSEKTPLSALVLCELVKKAGFPAGVVNMLSGYGPDAGAAISEHMGLDKVAFTGSTATGKRVASAAALSNLKRVTLELGGKSPLIITKEANIDQAVMAAYVGIWLNQGQCCIASSRVFVHESIYDKFIEKAVAKAKERKLTADPMDWNIGGYGSGSQGPQVDKIQFDRVMNYIDAGKKSGAKLLCGGEAAPQNGKGYYIQPTIFGEVPDDAKIAKEEIFGPVLCVMKYKDVEEVVKRANDTTFGLGAGVCCTDIAKAHRIAHRIRAGTVYVNCYDVFDANCPFGGFKGSGWGRELGPYAMKNYQEIKTVIVDMSTAPAITNTNQ